MKRKNTFSPEETVAFGRCLGNLLKSGDVLFLVGDLGAGKTHLSKGIAQGLEICDAITSPTYTIMQVYQGRLTLYHFDLYRLNRVEELEDIGFEEFVYGKGVTLIEWADKFVEYLPKERLIIRIEYHTEVTEGRSIILESSGARYDVLLEELEQICIF